MFSVCLAEHLFLIVSEESFKMVPPLLSALLELARKCKRKQREWREYMCCVERMPMSSVSDECQWSMKQCGSVRSFCRRVSAWFCNISLFSEITHLPPILCVFPAVRVQRSSQRQWDSSENYTYAPPPFQKTPSAWSHTTPTPSHRCECLHNALYIQL